MPSTVKVMSACREFVDEKCRRPGCAQSVMHYHDTEKTVDALEGAVHRPVVYLLDPRSGRTASHDFVHRIMDMMTTCHGTRPSRPAGLPVPPESRQRSTSHLPAKETEDDDREEGNWRQMDHVFKMFRGCQTCHESDTKYSPLLLEHDDDVACAILWPESRINLTRSMGGG